MLPGRLLQHEPVPVHWPVLSDLVPGPWPHEDRVRADPRLDPVRLGPHREEHPRDAARGDGHGGLQLGRGGREEGSHPDPPEQERHVGRRGRTPEGQGEWPALGGPRRRRDEELADDDDDDSFILLFSFVIVRARSIKLLLRGVIGAIDATLVLFWPLLGGVRPYPTTAPGFDVVDETHNGNLLGIVRRGGEWSHCQFRDGVLL